MDAGYPVPDGRHRAEQSIERSRFIATIAHTPTADAARALIDAVRAEFPDATHNCWAFVAGPPGTTTHIGLSDAGEPHGTAGRPMLDVLLHSGVGEVGAVVTRYFGGVKLGKGGLVRAYGGAVQHTLASLPTRLRID
ncbi:MAG: IMPACT family protein, partial [Longimicrobiales bacterium]